MTGKTCSIIGTRPEMIKMSPVVRACEGSGLDWFMAHTGQHYSHGGWAGSFLRRWGCLRRGIIWMRHGAQTGRMLADIEEILEENACQTQL